MFVVDGNLVAVLVAEKTIFVQVNRERTEWMTGRVFCWIQAFLSLLCSRNYYK